MFKNMSSVRLGVFVVLGLALLVVAIFLLGQKNSLFSSTFNVKAYFRDVQGLKNGATVRLSGIDIGSVNKITIVNDTSGRVEVSMNLQTDIQRFIRTDTKATIETEGLVGNKVVVLKIGSSSAEPIGDGGYIQAEEPQGFSAIIAQTEGTMQYMKTMTKDLSEIIDRINNGEGTIGKLINDDGLYKNAEDLTKQADQSLKSISDQLTRTVGVFDTLGSGVKTVVHNVDNVVSSIDTIISNVNQGRGVLGALLVSGKYDSTIASVITNVEKTSEDARLSASRLAENMEALKHNWLFKSYFENRGYWDEAKYEDDINAKLKNLSDIMKTIDAKIETLKKLEQNTK
jgi:phospholipid/cholesterol/gamma-HCH transport system substrate-binding protein